MSILTQIVQESIVKLLSQDISEGLGVFLEKGQKAAFELLCKLASCRMSEMGYCFMMGQVIGIAAVQSVCERKAAANISVADLQQKLATDGILNR